MRREIIFATLIGCLASLWMLPKAYAFGGFGHMLICEFADRFPRKKPAWHFANYPRDTKEILSDECVGAGECIFTGIKSEVADLKNAMRSDEKKGADLILLGHWVGDLHQPLHLSFKDDRGGNSIEKAGTCSADSLHAVWDKCMVEKEIAPIRGWRERFGYAETTRIYRAVDSMMSEISEANREDWKRGTLSDWANESYQIAIHEDVGYCTMRDNACWYDTNNKVLDEGEEVREIQMTTEYVKLWAPVVERRIKQAGVRLAAILDDALKE